ncbi:MAG: rhomboid family intramembrane serine protease [Deltaproteobacteria bacterium]|nr:MAG: rhomboid family intramembrane serine protease [Deltaproteobacteria bacterium]
MFPLRDENPLVRAPVATVAVIAINAAVWVFVQGLGSPEALVRSVCVYGLIPGEFLGTAAPGAVIPLGPDARCVLSGSGTLLTPLTSMFMHGGWFHIIGNLWFLWIFGDNVEDAMGPLRFLVFYLVCGCAAAAAQTVTQPDSLVPMVGASGAIGGVMGAYARLYPRAHIHTFVMLGFYITTISVPAIAMLGYWFLLQVLGGLPTLAGSAAGVAFWAHVGGFAAGVVLVGPFHRSDFLAAHRSRRARRTARHRLF